MQSVDICDKQKENDERNWFRGIGIINYCVLFGAVQFSVPAGCESDRCQQNNHPMPGQRFKGTIPVINAFFVTKSILLIAALV